MQIYLSAGRVQEYRRGDVQHEEHPKELDVFESYWLAEGGPGDFHLVLKVLELDAGLGQRG